MNISRILIVFFIVFFAELPDKSQFATLALSMRFRKSYVWVGAAAAFLIHVIIAVVAGKALTLLPHHLVETIVGVLFLVGAALIYFEKSDESADEVDQEIKPGRGKQASFLTAFTTSFVIIFLGEWGDITQVVTANYAAKYQDPLSVGIGAVTALWCISALSVTLGEKLLNHIRAKTLKNIIALLMVIFAIISLTSVIK